jgi:hypothetical protein
MSFKEWLENKIAEETKALESYHTRAYSQVALQVLKEVKEAYCNNQPLTEVNND